jgi:hypothetical protein
MFGPLIVLIILIPLFLIGLFWAFAPYQLYKYHGHRLKYTRPDMGDYEIEFENMRYEVRELKEAGRDEELATLQKHYKRSRFWYKVWSDYDILRGAIFAILCIAIFIFLMWSIVDPLSVRAELVEWEEFTIIAKEVMTSSTNELERVGIVNKMLEYNEWLADARASQKLWGNWSSYYNFDLPEPLLLP